MRVPSPLPQAQFEAVAASVKTYVPGAGKVVSTEDKLKAYGLYKQATVGDNNTDRCVAGEWSGEGLNSARPAPFCPAGPAC